MTATAAPVVSAHRTGKARRIDGEERSPRPRLLGAVGAVAAVVFLLRAFAVQVYGITTPSMAGTLRSGDYVITSNAIFGARIPFTPRSLPALREPQQGEVVVFDDDEPGPGTPIIKRIIGMPGDTLRMVGRRVLRNGVALHEPYLARPSTSDEPLHFDGPHGVRWHLDALAPVANRAAYRPTRDNWGPLVVPAGHYFVMGDNRDWSVDSRYTGFVPRDRIRGKVLAVYFSMGPDPARPFPRIVTAARPNRIGAVR